MGSAIMTDGQAMIAWLIKSSDGAYWCGGSHEWSRNHDEAIFFYRERDAEAACYFLRPAINAKPIEYLVGRSEQAEPPDALVEELNRWSDDDCSPCPIGLGGRSLGRAAADRIAALTAERDAAVSLRKLAHTAKSRAEDAELRCAAELDEARSALAALTAEMANQQHDITRLYASLQAESAALAAAEGREKALREALQAARLELSRDTPQIGPALRIMADAALAREGE